MTQSRFISRRGLLLAATATLAASVAGCGRKGPLEPPPGTWSPPGGNELAKPPRNPTAPDRPFILDPLLK